MRAEITPSGDLKTRTCLRRGAEEVAPFAQERQHTRLVKNAIDSFTRDDGASPAWINLAVFVKPQVAFDSSTTGVPRLGALLLALGMGQTPGLAQESDLGRFDRLRDLFNRVDSWDSRARGTLLLHALRQATVRYRTASVLQDRSRVTPWVVELLRHFFLNHRQLWAILKTGDYCSGAVDDDPLDELREELAHLDQLKRSARIVREILRTATRRSLEARSQGEETDETALRQQLQGLLHGNLSSQPRRSKPTLLSQHSFLVVAPTAGADSTWATSPHTLPYREVLHELVQSLHYSRRSDGAWAEAEVPEIFQRLIEAAYSKGWPADIVDQLFSHKVRADAYVPRGRWISDGEFTVFFLLVRRAWGNGPLPRALLLPDFAEREQELLANSMYEWPSSPEEFLTAELGISSVKSPRFLALFNFLQRQMVHSCPEVILCSPKCGLPTLFNDLYSALIDGADIEKLLRLEVPSCCAKGGDRESVIESIRRHSYLPSLLIEAELRQGRTSPTSLFLLPLFESAAGMSSTGAAPGPRRSHRPLAIYAGTFISLESELWPHVLARHECHLDALYDLMNPVVDVLTANAIREYMDTERRHQVSKEGFDRTVKRFIGGLDRLDNLDSGLSGQLQRVDTSGVVTTAQDYLRLREKALSRIGVTLAGALRALGSQRKGADLERIEERFEGVLVNEITDGSIRKNVVGKYFSKLLETPQEQFAKLLSESEKTIASSGYHDTGKGRSIGEIFAFYIEQLHIEADLEERRRIIREVLRKLNITLPSLFSEFLVSTHRYAHGHKISGSELARQWDMLPVFVRNNPALACVRDFIDERRASEDNCCGEFNDIWQPMRLHGATLGNELAACIDAETAHNDFLTGGTLDPLKFEKKVQRGILALPAVPYPGGFWQSLLRALIEERKNRRSVDHPIKFRVTWNNDTKQTEIECHQPHSEKGLQRLKTLRFPKASFDSWPEEPHTVLLKTMNLWSLCRGWLEIELVLENRRYSVFRNMTYVDEADFATGVRFLFSCQDVPSVVWG